MPKKKMENPNVNSNAQKVVSDLMDILVDIEKKTEKLREMTGKGTGAREIAVSITKIQEARMWLREAWILLANPNDWD